jgi:hypothetical protein
MPPTDLTPKWKRWIKPGRLIPSLTILGAGSVGVLSYLGIVVLSIPESIIIFTFRKQGIVNRPDKKSGR